MASAAEMRKLIAEILETADLTSISAKKVRQELEAKLDEDLSEKKKEIDDMVLEILQDKQNGDKGSKRKDESDSEEESTPKKRKKQKKSDSSDSEEDTKRKKRKPAAKGKGKGGGGAGTGYTKLCKLSPELSKVMGEENMARHEVVKKMWAIVKERQLYDPKNKQFAICDADLLTVFGVKRFRTFGMMKYLKNHFLD